MTDLYYEDEEILSETEQKLEKYVVIPLMALRFYTITNVGDPHPDNTFPIRIPPESLSESRYGMFTELTFKVLIPRGYDYWIDGIVKILNAFGTHVHHYEVCSPKYTSAERIEAQYIFKVHI